MNDRSEALIKATADLVGRTGATGFSIEHFDSENPGVIPWVAYAFYADQVWECAAGVHPAVACIRLLEVLVDGGQCTHCHRPTVVDDNWESPVVSADPTSPMCSYLFDPSTARFVRACAGDEDQ
jgi:hypothetical protein